MTALLLLQSAALPSFQEVQLRDCIKLARSDPNSAIVNADIMTRAGGGYLADICQAEAHASARDYPKAADIFAKAAALAASAKDDRAANLWAQAGNAAIAAGQNANAITYLTKALDGAGQPPQKRAEILIDRARAQVASDGADGNDVAEDDVAAANADLAEVRRITPDNGLAWLLSATLARRSGDLANAQNYIKTAADLSPSDAAVALEAGNIAAAAGAYRIAREQWQQVIKIAPDSPQAQAAKILLSELDAIEANAADTGSETR
ncbi:hypothetical protein [Sphingorhabdus arenilitoris]|uniref:hypothetical protein n=1 Tax=Sphingorhabdus arenilitoris TaxID=1490041 RepID=UPI0036D307E7